jgi:transcriptional regulator with XRE-family HTH domain
MDRTDIRIIIGKNIRHRRLLAGLTQNALGKHIGVAAQQLQKYENGTNGINCDKLIELAQVFRCSVDDLCNGAVEVLKHDPKNPWNPYRVHTLISHFNRIRSHAIRDKVCNIVHTMADIVSRDAEETL